VDPEAPAGRYRHDPGRQLRSIKGIDQATVAPVSPSAPPSTSIRPSC